MTTAAAESIAAAEDMEFHGIITEPVQMLSCSTNTALVRMQCDASERRNKVAFSRPADYSQRVAVYKRPFFTSYTTSLWIRFLRFGLQSHKKLESGLDKAGLTPPQFYVLATIGYAGELPFGEIGQKMMVTVSNLTGIVDRLEEKKLVVRKRDDNDRRVVYVVLTEKGAKLYKTAIPLFEKSVGEIFAVLSPPEQKELSSLLRKLNQEAPAS